MTTTVQKVAMVFGVGFIIAALAGFFAGGALNMSMDADPLTAPRALGLFPVNLLHNLVHLAFGIWGILAARSFRAARSYAQIGGIIYLVLVVVGFLSPSGFGLVPLGGNDIWLHIFLGAVLVYFGFTARDTMRHEPVATV